MPKRKKVKVPPRTYERVLFRSPTETVKVNFKVIEGKVIQIHDKNPRPAKKKPEARPTRTGSERNAFGLESIPRFTLEDKKYILQRIGLFGGGLFLQIKVHPVPDMDEIMQQNAYNKWLESKGLGGPRPSKQAAQQRMF